MGATNGASERTMDELTQIVRLLILAIPVAWVAWTLTHEEIFSEVREFCTHRSRTCRRLAERKFFYLFTCEYCLSHWAALAFECLFQFRMVFDDWRGYLVGYSALIWTANIYMNLYLRVRVDIRKERAVADSVQKEVEGKKPRAA
jgi:hypothetical protein